VKPTVKTRVDALTVEVYPSRAAMGAAAAAEFARAFGSVIAAEGSCRAMFAAAPSQTELLAGLRAAADIDWSRAEAFHMDEYVGLPADAPQRFGSFLREHLFDRVPFARAHYMLSGRGASATPGPSSDEADMERYGALLAQAPMDIICLGIGENGHLAFNDPPVARFDDPVTVKVVELDPVCRQQQVNDGCFPSFEAVPRTAVTVTIPVLMAGRRLVCVVPGRRKAAAVRAMLTGPIATSCPASVLRRHPACTLYLDGEAATDWLAGERQEA
jgi:glucosamine-6-phosphate deaminase